MPTDDAGSGEGRPYVLLSAAMSVDGCLDDTSGERLRLSNSEDFDRVEAVRAEYDAILVGAGTIRRDNPRLLVRSDARRADRVARGLPEHPVKVTITGSGLDASAEFFRTGGQKIVYCPAQACERVRDELAGVAEVVGAGDPLDLGLVLDDLGRRGTRRLMVEGGGTVHTQFLTEGLVDEIHLAVAPFFVGQSAAPRFVGPGFFPQDAAHRMRVAEVRQIGDVALVRYLVSTREGEPDA
ncbi:dihydrofolate reductase family protein [Streptomyces sp. NBC_01351]|uniref:RibD family protein n=1 Tax=Streptomyces sp. NBC_01351 TaxID=2903833 RepID=UPI002E355052|nr:dihydrofolate reductase family protein [Streptomyces sp. NBC_01351]